MSGRLMFRCLWESFGARLLLVTNIALLLLASCVPATEVVALKPVLASPGSGAIVDTKEGLYYHPSGAFALLPLSDDFEEGQNFVIFHEETATVDASFGKSTEPINDDNALEVLTSILDELLLLTGKAIDYEITSDEPELINRGYLVFFQVSPTRGNDTLGSLYIRREGEILYTVLLLTADYAAIADAWQRQVESFISGGELAAERPWLGNTKTAIPDTDGISGLSAEDADSGFRPETNGFNFKNYGNSIRPLNLTADEVRRLFGDSVCASWYGGECILTPTAQEWMEQANEGMESGHGEGMAVLSGLMYYELVDPGQFGGSNAADLEWSNQALQREIAYWWATQVTYPWDFARINDSPRVVVQTLMDAFSQGMQTTEWWTLGIYRRDGSGGQSVTPIAVDDRGDEIFKILVYDSNFPGEVRSIDVDANANTWSYQVSTDQDDTRTLYQGDASTQTLEAIPISPRLDMQQCDFCLNNRSVTKAENSAVAEQGVYQGWLKGSSKFLIIDEQGRRMGQVGDKYIREIPGAKFYWLKNGQYVLDEKTKPVFRFPVMRSFEITMNGSSLQETDNSEVSVIGPGYFFSVENLWTKAKNQDRIEIAADGSEYRLTYMMDSGGSPVIMFGLETTLADYAFLLKTTEVVESQAELDVVIDIEQGVFILSTQQFDKASEYIFNMIRIDDNGEDAFGVDEIVMQPNETIYFNFLDWGQDGGFMTASIDQDNDGMIDETVELPDELEIFIWDQ